MKNCPYCGKAMRRGQLFAPRSSAVYWLPEEAKLKGWVVSTKSVQESGGEVLGEASPYGFLAKSRLVTYHCEECRCFLSF